MSTLAATVEKLTKEGCVPAEAVLALRALVFGADIAVSPQEAEALIGLDEAVEDPSAEWRDFFLEVMTDFVVRQQTPSGYVDETKAKWLVDRIARDGRLKTRTELALLLYVLERAERAPESLSAFAVSQVTRAVLEGDAAIDREEVEYVRRVIYAGGGAMGIAVSRKEAEALFDLNDAARGKWNDPAWTDLFARAVGNALMFAPGYTAPSREEALRQDAWLQAPPEGPFKFFDRLLSGGGFGEGSTLDAQWTEHNARWARDLETAAVVTADEAAPLIERIGRDGELDENEKALLRFLKAEAPDLHPSLKPLLDQAA